MLFLIMMTLGEENSDVSEDLHIIFNTKFKIKLFSRLKKKKRLRRRRKSREERRRKRKELEYWLKNHT